MAVLLGIFSLNTDSVEISEPRLYVVETGYQERTKVVLPDSTQVWLNAASRLTYTDDFMVNNREVEIAGEAFFDVTRNEELPFVVRFAGNTITVKGTRFNVTAYDVEDKVYAALVEGCIEFAGNIVKLDMNPGELLSYDTNSEDVVKCKADLSSHVSWVGGKLDYSAITLDQLLTRLSSIYGFKVKYDPVKYVNHTFRIILSTNESLNDVLDAVSIIVPFDWKYEDGIVTIIEK
jgi:ferric-dicitrate binding protein FerR (iron transport regulator)